MEQNVNLKIDSPNIRLEIKKAFEDLANLKILKIDLNSYPHIYWSKLSNYVLNIIIDGVIDCSNPTEIFNAIGVAIYDKEEAEQIYEFCRWFNELLDSIDPYYTFSKPDSAYLNHPEWPKVYEGAKKLYELMDENDKKYNFSEEYEAYRKAEDAKYYK
ncbi:SCO4402 family protein [Rickettsia endosymbiont of Orchestes rusci]|uniref:SCO4402 family protein n=1 Tax=Rickettsia endosymbiont of Orchestes rusci TaxID=3066250 RepID=UPI00313E33E7